MGSLPNLPGLAILAFCLLQDMGRKEVVASPIFLQSEPLPANTHPSNVRHGAWLICESQPNPVPTPLCRIQNFTPFSSPGRMAPFVCRFHHENTKVRKQKQNLTICAFALSCFRDSLFAPLRDLIPTKCLITQMCCGGGADAGFGGAVRRVPSADAVDPVGQV